MYCCVTAAFSGNIMQVPREQRMISTFTSRHAKRQETFVCQHDAESTVAFGPERTQPAGNTSPEYATKTKCVALSQIDM